MSFLKYGAVLVLIGLLVLLQVNNEPVVAVTLKSHARAIAVHSASQLLVLADMSGEAVIWDLKGKKRHWVLDRSKHGIDSVAIAPDGQSIVVASDEDMMFTNGAYLVKPDSKQTGIKARVFGAVKGEERATIKSDYSIGCAQFDPSGQWLVTAGRCTVEAWDVKTWKRVAINSDFVPFGLRCLAFPPSGKLVAVAGLDGRIAFLSLPDLVEVGTVEVSKKALTALVFVDNGKKCVCGGWDGTLYTIDTAKKAQLFSMDGFGEIIGLVAAEERGQVAIAASGIPTDATHLSDYVVAVDLKTNKKLSVFEIQKRGAGITVMALLPDQNTLAIGRSGTKDVIFVKLPK